MALREHWKQLIKVNLILETALSLKLNAQQALFGDLKFRKIVLRPFSSSDRSAEKPNRDIRRYSNFCPIFFPSNLSKISFSFPFFCFFFVSCSFSSSSSSNFHFCLRFSGRWRHPRAAPNPFSVLRFFRARSSASKP